MTGRGERIALVLAGGAPREGLGPGGRMSKALVDVHGTPLVTRTAASLVGAGCSRIFVLHDADDPVGPAVDCITGVLCVPRTGPAREYAAGIRAGLRAIAERVPRETLRTACILGLSCDLALAEAEDFAALFSAFETGDLDVAMALGHAGSAARHLPGRRLSVVRLRGSDPAVVQPVVALRGALLHPDPAGFRFADWSVADMDRVENLLRSARERRGTPWRIPLLVYREVLRRIDSPLSFVRLLRAVIRFATGRLDTATAVGVVTDLSGIRFGVLRNERWRLCFDVDSAADLQFAESSLSRRPNPATATV